MWFTVQNVAPKTRMTRPCVLTVALLFTAQAQRKDLTRDIDGTEMNTMVITEEAEPSEA
jgi:hypothetical protein